MATMTPGRNSSVPRGNRSTLVHQSEKPSRKVGADYRKIRDHPIRALQPSQSISPEVDLSKVYSINRC
jgi:hypothetical protein